MSPRRAAPAEPREAVQSSLFDLPPCRSCGRAFDPHFLPNYEPPVWVAAHGPKCGLPVYAPTKDGLWGHLQGSNP